MGREVRMVPANWEHPRNSSGKYIPLYTGDWYQSSLENYPDELAEWKEGERLWSEGKIKRYGGDVQTIEDFLIEYKNRNEYSTIPDHPDYAWYAGEIPRQPDPNNYMPVWKPEECTHYMMYEDTSEGTPISPAFATPEELARWLADTGASAFADMTATYEQWLRTINRGFAVSAVIIPGQGMISGVAD